LGTEKRLVEDIKSIEENPFSNKVSDRIREYNREQKDKAKDSVTLLNNTFCV
jgi:hypothetical protein